MMKRDIFQYIAAFFLLFATVIFPVFFLSPAEQIEIKEEEPPPPFVNPFDDIVLEAKAAYVFDINTGETLFSKKAQAQLPLASLTKVMVALVALERAPESTIVTIRPEFLMSEGDSGFLVGERWRLDDLLNFTLMESSNDGADAIATVFGALGSALEKSTTSKNSFLEAMNDKVSEIGLTQTYFLNETGLDLEDGGPVSGSYGSARDVTSLFLYALRTIPDILEATRYETLSFTTIDGFIHEAKNTNELVPRIPGFIAGKTGFTDLAGGNLVIAFDAGPGRPIVISVLGSSIDGRFTDTEALVWATFAYLQNF